MRLAPRSASAARSAAVMGRRRSGSRVAPAARYGPPIGGTGPASREGDRRAYLGHMEEPVAAGGAAPGPRTRLRLDSIRDQLIAFAVLAALIPAVTIAAIAYQQTRKALVENITAALSSTSSQSARALDLWAKERAYDLRVYTGSYEVLENLERAARSRDVAARNRLTRYLDAVRGRTGDYELLAVTNLRGAVAAVSPARGAPAAALTGLPADWLATVGRDET